MLIWKLAWRSLSRHLRRSLLTGITVALGLAMMLVFLGINDDGHARMAEMGVRLGAGHVLVQERGYDDEPTLDHVIDDPDAVIAAALALDRVVTVAPRVRTSGLVSAGSKSAGVAITAVDPARERAVSAIADSLRDGDYLRPADDPALAGLPGDLLLGDRLALRLGVGLGDRIVVTASPRGSGDPAAGAFTVRGIFHTGVADVDAFYVEIALGEADELFAMDGAISQLAVFGSSIDDADPIAGALSRALSDRPELVAMPWHQALRELAEAIALDSGGMYLMMAIIFVIVAIGIFNTMLMSVIERTRELGVMMALGTPRRTLFGIVVAEAALLAAAAVAGGLAIGLSLHAWIARVGIDVGAFYGDGGLELAGIAFDGRIYSRLTVEGIVTWCAVVAALVVLASLYPAWRVTRLEPVEAMRHV